MRTSVDSFRELEQHDKKLVVAVLKQLRSACRDCQAVYAQAAVDVRDPSLEPVFEAYARQRGEFADQLGELLEAVGSPEDAKPDDPSLGAQVHLKWLDVRSALERRNAVPMLSECESSDYTVLKKYEAALDKVRFPMRVEEVLIDQLSAIRDAHGRLDRMHR